MRGWTGATEKPTINDNGFAPHLPPTAVVPMLAVVSLKYSTRSFAVNGVITAVAPSSVRTGIHMTL